MRWLALLLAAMPLAFIADFAQTGGDRVRAAARQRIDGPLARAVEDWQMATWTAVGLAAWATGWVAALSPGRTAGSGRLARVVRTSARWGVVAAALGGMVLAGGATTLATLGGAGRPPLDRYELEVRVLGGIWFGAVVGSAIGAGLGAVRRSDLPE